MDIGKADERQMQPVTGVVVEGKRIGRTMNFPTANVRPETGTDVPRRGVYAAFACVDGARYLAIVNVGKHPTLPDGEPTIEAHLLDFSGDLYGRTLTLTPVKYLRPETRFASKDELAAQLARDAQAARALLQTRA